MSEAEPVWGDRAWTMRREGRAAHLVEKGPFDVWRCDCLAWQYRRECVHVTFIREKHNG